MAGSLVPFSLSTLWTRGELQLACKPQRCTWFSEPEQGFLQLFGGVLLQLHLGMAVCPLQERGVPVACQLRHSLLVHPFMEHGGDEIVAQGKNVIEKSFPTPRKFTGQEIFSCLKM